MALPIHFRHLNFHTPKSSHPLIFTPSIFSRQQVDVWVLAGLLGRWWSLPQNKEFLAKSISLKPSKLKTDSSCKRQSFWFGLQVHLVYNRASDTGEGEPPVIIHVFFRMHERAGHKETRFLFPNCYETFNAFFLSDSRCI